MKVGQVKKRLWLVDNSNNMRVGWLLCKLMKDG